ncbi:hypothetical protein ES703_90406 [subsurface metagenome]
MYNNDKILKNNKNLPQNVKNKLKSEAAKPHTPFEISDFEFPFKFEKNLYYICFVIKSGREITGESVPISFQYQLKRPFEELENVIVVFLTAKKASEVLKNWIKKHNSKYPGQQIETIEKKIPQIHYISSVPKFIQQVKIFLIELFVKRMFPMFLHKTID